MAGDTRSPFTLIRRGIIDERPDGISDELYSDLRNGVQGLDDNEWYVKMEQSMTGDTMTKLTEDREEMSILFSSECPSNISQERYDSIKRAISSLPNTSPGHMREEEERRARVLGGAAGSAAGGTIGWVSKVFGYHDGASTGRRVGESNAVVISDSGTKKGISNSTYGWSSGSAAGGTVGAGAGPISWGVGYVAGGVIGVGAVGYQNAKAWWFGN